MACNRTEIVCRGCLKSVRNNQDGIYCNIFCRWLHLRCIDLSSSLFSDLSNSSEDWYCLWCVSSVFPFNHYEDQSEFNYELHSFMDDAHMNFSNLSSLVLNQFDLGTASQMLNSCDYDPDWNFFNGSTVNIDSLYINPCELSELVHLSMPWLLHINCRSIKNKLNDIIDLLHIIKIYPTIIAVSELWLKDDDL